MIASVLRDRPERFRRPTNQGRIVREMGFETGLFFANDEVWKRQRRMVMAALDPGHVKSFFPSLKTVVSRLESRWRKAAAAGTVIDLQADLMRYTVDAIAGLAFGADVNTLESDEDVIQRHLNQIFPALARRSLAAFPYWRYLRLPADRRLERSVGEVKAAIEGFIAQARQRMRDDPTLRSRPRNLLEAMIVAADVPGSEVDDRDIAGNVFIALIAGEDTTANTLAWLFDFLHRHPEAMRRAREEVKRVAPDPAAFTLDQMADLAFVDACINETMRLKPVAPLLPSQANRDTVVGDVEVPADTFVVGVMRADALDERHFPRPASFEPERWLARARSAELALRHARVDAVRCRAAALSRALSRASGNEDGDRDAPRRLHHPAGRHARRNAGARAVRFRDGAGRTGDDARSFVTRPVDSQESPGGRATRPSPRSPAGGVARAAGAAVRGQAGGRFAVTRDDSRGPR